MHTIARTLTVLVSAALLAGCSPGLVASREVRSPVAPAPTYPVTEDIDPEYANVAMDTLRLYFASRDAWDPSDPSTLARTLSYTTEDRARDERRWFAALEPDDDMSVIGIVWAQPQFSDSSSTSISMCVTQKDPADDDIAMIAFFVWSITSPTHLALHTMFRDDDPPLPCP
ncbi:hypothetical protein [Microbacterium gorillae]|uniref:hypothetical protein n=1 Tax=Microbacterium gorillae TaxID=1231063 RepID=UPI00058EAD27|nr:hypothetical protein [Microbacterium gorillae]